MERRKKMIQFKMSKRYSHITEEHIQIANKHIKNFFTVYYVPETVPIIYLILFNHTMQWELLLSHYRDKETGTERVNNFSKVTQVVSEVSGRLALNQVLIHQGCSVTPAVRKI